MDEEKLTALLSEAFALECGFSPGEARKIRIAALLHDIGKTALPPGILSKPGKLTAREFEVVKTHTTEGAAMLAGVQGEIGGMIRDVCLLHHEAYDGSGYWGKTARELPAYVPIVSICDVYVALLSERPYKQAWPQDHALENIRNQAGTRFSPTLTETFCAMIAGGGVPAVLSGRTVGNERRTE